MSPAQAARLGQSIPADTPHVSATPCLDFSQYHADHPSQAVSVSLPTWSTNVGYEEGQDWVVKKMICGYPRSAFILRLLLLGFY